MKGRAGFLLLLYITSLLEKAEVSDETLWREAMSREPYDAAFEQHFA